MKNTISSLSSKKSLHLTLVSVVSLASTLGLSACQQTPDYNYLIGETMGTSYHISYQLPDDADEAAIQAAVDERLKQINDSMSTYQNDSTISTFIELPVFLKSRTIDFNCLSFIG